jgi:hypothetical protein
LHTLHWIATKANSRQEAFDTVSLSLLPSDEGYRLADWSDWHVVGGGRYSASHYEPSQDMIISYAETPDKFMKVLSDIKQYRIKFMNEKLIKLDNAFDRLKSDVVDYISNDCKPESNQRFDFSRWDIKETINMLNGQWTPDSGFYDHNEFTSEFQYLEERLDKPEEAALHYLVPVDFHF